ncbi:MAG: hypothetical protein KKE39_06735 [Bacteroidetes bacterium]|nr:hypothetical protein [Bacteroidota bacterium]MBU1760409.1 hypothetical protein [Bacteroidota bacterium]
MQATFGHALAMAGHSMIFCPNKSTVNEQKDDIIIHSSIENFQPEPQPNSEQKADNISVCPAIANAMQAAVLPCQ